MIHILPCSEIRCIRQKNALFIDILFAELPNIFGAVDPEEPCFVFASPGKKGPVNDYAISNFENMKNLCDIERKLHEMYQKKATGKQPLKKGMSLIVKIADCCYRGLYLGSRMMSGNKCKVYLEDLLFPVEVPAKNMRGMPGLDPNDPINSTSSAFQQIVLGEPLSSSLDCTVQRFLRTPNGLSHQASGIWLFKGCFTLSFLPFSLPSLSLSIILNYLLNSGRRFREWPRRGDGPPPLSRKSAKFCGTK